MQTAAADGRRLAAGHTHVAYLLISTADSSSELTNITHSRSLIPSTAVKAAGHQQAAQAAADFGKINFFLEIGNPNFL